MQLNALINLVERYSVYVVMISCGAALVAFLMALFLTFGNRKLKRRLVKLESADKAVKWEETPDPENYQQQLDRIEREFSSVLRHVAMVRFDAFEHVGNGLSFALAVLNDMGDGFVISSLFGGEETRTYAKQITGGKPSHPLSPEEEEAIRKAMSQ